jgi:hypothetical protein
MTSGPQAPIEYDSDTEYPDDAALEAADWAAGLDVWGPVEKAYENFVQEGDLANAQLWSLREAIRRELLTELRGIVEAAPE